MGKYNKEDLLWEAVRRNENYKSLFNSAEFPKKYNKYHGLEIPIDSYWKLFRLYDPTIDIDEIRKLIDNGEDPRTVHPYFHLFEKPKPVVFHGIPGSKYYIHDNPYHQYPHYQNPYTQKYYESPHDFLVSREDKNILRIKKSELMNRVVISFDPSLTDEEIINEIKKIKTYALSARGVYDHEKHERLEMINTENFEDEDRPTWRHLNIVFPCYTREIPSYMDWLKKYDHVINHCRMKAKENPKSSEFLLSEEDGAFTLATHFTFQQMVPETVQYGTREHDNCRRIWQDQYESAVRLIKSAPNIEFRSSKRNKPKPNKKPHR